MSKRKDSEVTNLRRKLRAMKSKTKETNLRILQFTELWMREREMILKKIDMMEKILQAGGDVSPQVDILKKLLSTNIDPNNIQIQTVKPKVEKKEGE